MYGEEVCSNYALALPNSVVLAQFVTSLVSRSSFRDVTNSQYPQSSIGIRLYAARLLLSPGVHALNLLGLALRRVGHAGILHLGSSLPQHAARVKHFVAACLREARVKSDTDTGASLQSSVSQVPVSSPVSSHPVIKGPISSPLDERPASVSSLRRSGSQSPTVVLTGAAWAGPSVGAASVSMVTQVGSLKLQARYGRGEAGKVRTG